MQERGKNKKEGEERTDKEADRSGRDDSGECERDGRRERAINNTRPPSMSAARLRSDIFRFLMKRETVKNKNLSSAKITKMWRREGSPVETFTRLIFRTDIKLLRPHVCSQSLSAPLWADARHGGAQVWWECRALSLSLCCTPPGYSGTNELTFLSHAHSCDMISESEQAENEKGRLIFFPFPLLRDCVMSAEPDEHIPLHRRAPDRQ